MSQLVLTQREGAVLHITLNRPERLNAMTLELFDDMSVAFDAAASPEIRCVLIRGEGKAFCVGGDIRVFAEVATRGDIIPTSAPDLLHTTIEKLRSLEKPVLAAVHGPCAGAGLSLALACDLVIAADNAKFNLAYAGIGLSPDGGSTYFLPRHVGLKRATEIFFTGGTLTAKEALELGLINRIVEPDELGDTATQMATILASGPTQAYARVKKLLAASSTNSLTDQLALESRCFSDSSATPDFREGVKAFLEKRPPEFTGKP